MKTYNWGILSTGKIAAKFVEGLKATPGARVYAVASRDEGKARQFARHHGIPVAHGSYEALAADPAVDIIYIASPNNLHHPHTLMCIGAGKATLCEKPFALNSQQLAEMVSLARQKKVFLMEALWTRFLPTISKVEQLIAGGEIGYPLILKAEFGFRATYDPASRLFDPALGGGSLLDIGIYPVFLALLLFGKPLSIKASAVKAPTGVDLSTGIVMTHEGGRMSVLTSTFAASLPTEAQVVGDKGHITLHRMFHMPTRLTITQGDHTSDIPLTFAGNGYNYEAAELMRCLEQGLSESSTLPLRFSLQLMDILTEIKRLTDEG